VSTLNISHHRIRGVLLGLQTALDILDTCKDIELAKKCIEDTMNRLKDRGETDDR